MKRVAMAFFATLILTSLSSPIGHANGSCTKIGTRTYCSDGSSSTQIGGTTYNSNGTSSTKIGGTTYCSGFNCTTGLKKRP